MFENMKGLSFRCAFVFNGENTFAGIKAAP